jgi:hypothetical protein
VEKRRVDYNFNVVEKIQGLADDCRGRRAFGFFRYVLAFLDPGFVFFQGPGLRLFEGPGPVLQFFDFFLDRAPAPFPLRREQARSQDHVDLAPVIMPDIWGSGVLVKPLKDN